MIGNVVDPLFWIYDCSIWSDIYVTFVTPREHTTLGDFA